MGGKPSYFQRRDSKRLSKRVQKMDITADENIEQAIINNDVKEKSLKDIKEILSRRLDNLKKSDHTTEIESLLDILKGLKTKSISVVTNETMEDSDQLTKTIERLEDVLTDFKKFPQSFKDSFEDVSNEIYKAIEDNFNVVEKTKKESANEKSAPRRKNSQAKETRLQTEVPDKNEILAIPTVQILYSQDGDLMKNIQKDLQISLGNKLGNTVNFIHLYDVSKVDDNVLLIIVCYFSTRVVPDAAHSLRDIKNPSNASLLLIQAGEAHTRSDTNSSLHLTGKEFDHLRGIFDMFFSKNDHVFVQCDMNEQSINRLCSFCKEHPISVRMETRL